MKFQIDFSLAIKDAVKQYKNLSEESKVITNTQIVTILTLIIIALAIHFLPGHWSEYASVNVFLGIILSIVAASCFSVLDKVGVISPVEKDIKKSVEDLKSNVENISIKFDGSINNFEENLISIRSEIEEDIHRISSQMHKVQEGFLDFDKYRSSRFRFGLNSVIGKDRIIPHAVDNYHNSVRDCVLEEIGKVPSGHHVYFMNSLISNDGEYSRVIEAAINRGVTFKMLLMKPDVKSAAVVSRYEDFFQKEYNYSSIEMFVGSIIGRYYAFDKMRREINERKRNYPVIGDFLIRYYRDSSNFPMMLVSDPNIDQKPYVAFTGFYAGFKTEDMPWVEWRGGKYRIIEVFFDLFMTRWDRAQDCTYLFPENEPHYDI